MLTENEPTTQAERKLYLHIGDGGVSFSVTSDERGRPVLAVKATHLGHTTNQMELLTNRRALAQPGEMLSAASNDDFPLDEYAYAARVVGAGTGGQTGGR